MLRILIKLALSGLFVSMTSGSSTILLTGYTMKYGEFSDKLWRYFAVGTEVLILLIMLILIWSDKLRKEIINA